jgi:hypothetical protein
MATPKVKYPYNFFYRDKSFVTFELTKDDFKKIVEFKISGKNIVPVSIGFIDVTDVVTAVEKRVDKEIDKPTKDTPKDETYESFSKRFGLPDLDEESREYLQKSLVNLWEGEQ